MWERNRIDWQLCISACLFLIFFSVSSQTEWSRSKHVLFRCWKSFVLFFISHQFPWILIVFFSWYRSTCTPSLAPKSKVSATTDRNGIWFLSRFHSFLLSYPINFDSDSSIYTHPPGYCATEVQCNIRLIGFGARQARANWVSNFFQSPQRIEHVFLRTTRSIYL